MPVNKTANSEVLPANLLDHRAVQAWRRIKPERFEPQNIEVLKLEENKSAVYRLTGVGSNGSAVIAKRCIGRTVARNGSPRCLGPPYRASRPWAEPLLAVAALRTEHNPSVRPQSGFV